MGVWVWIYQSLIKKLVRYWNQPLPTYISGLSQKIGIMAVAPQQNICNLSGQVIIWYFNAEMLNCIPPTLKPQTWFLQHSVAELIL